MTYHTVAVEGQTKDLSIRCRVYLTFLDKKYTDEQFCSVVQEVKRLCEIDTAEITRFIDSLSKPKSTTKKKAVSEGS